MFFEEWKDEAVFQKMLQNNHRQIEMKDKSAMENKINRERINQSIWEKQH